MLPGDAAAHGETRVQQLVVGGLGALELAGHEVVVEDQRVEVAVARVEDIGDDQAVPGRDRLHLPHDLGQAGAGHHGVLQEPGRGQATEDARGFLSTLPQERSLRLVLGHADLEGGAAPAHLHDARGLLVDLRPRTVELDEEDGARAFRIARADALFDGADDDLVDHLEGGGDDSRPHDGRDRLRGVVDGRERRQERLDAFGHVEQSHRHRGQEPEGPLPAHEGAGEIVARLVLDFPPHAQHLARSRDELEPQHVIDRDPVLETVRPAGIRRGVAADRGHHLAGRIGSEVVAVLAGRLGEPEVDETGLHGGPAIVEVQLEDAVHPRQRDHDTAHGRHGAADEPRAGAARDEGNVLAPTETDHRGDLLRALGQHHRVRSALVEGVHVALVGHPTFRRRHEAPGADDALELAQHAGT